MDFPDYVSKILSRHDSYFIFLDLSIRKRARKKDINIAPTTIQKICIAPLS